MTMAGGLTSTSSCIFHFDTGKGTSRATQNAQFNMKGLIEKFTKVVKEVVHLSPINLPVKCTVYVLFCREIWVRFYNIMNSGTSWNTSHLCLLRVIKLNYCIPSFQQHLTYTKSDVSNA